MLKENINFLIKGYDVLKSIQNKLVEIKSEKLCNNNFTKDIDNTHKNNTLFIKEVIKSNNINKLDNTSNFENSISTNNSYNNKNIIAKIFSNMNFFFAIEFSLESFS